ncbi:hypothetical protein ACFZCU_06980 [Streptomyces canus]|uniref:hypothetical protein n=1 Tax=Streptomyces canus TaxID=58343 RepID=UPI0036E7A230
MWQVFLRPALWPAATELDGKRGRWAEFDVGRQLVLGQRIEVHLSRAEVGAGLHSVRRLHRVPCGTASALVSVLSPSAELRLQLAAPKGQPRSPGWRLVVTNLESGSGHLQEQVVLAVVGTGQSVPIRHLLAPVSSYRAKPDWFWGMVVEERLLKRSGHID